jgi:hypothetical protein
MGKLKKSHSGEKKVSQHIIMYMVTPKPAFGEGRLV